MITNPQRLPKTVFHLITLVLMLLTVAAASAQQPPILPNPKLTPGATLAVTVQDIAVPGYTKKVRNVPQAVKDHVYAEYGITRRAPREYEVDHLISLELGGSNSIRNLWPQSYLTQPWNAHVKDRLENKLHQMVVSGQISLPDAQRMIATNWIAAYKQVFHTDQPLAKEAGREVSRRLAGLPHGVPTLHLSQPHPCRSGSTQKRAYIITLARGGTATPRKAST